MRLIPFLILVTACIGTPARVYPPADVQIDQIAVDRAGALTLIYRVPLETLYSSPGLLVTRSDGELHLQVVRCALKATCRVDVQSTLEEGGYLVSLSKADVVRVLIEDSSSGLSVPVSKSPE